MSLSCDYSIYATQAPLSSIRQRILQQLLPPVIPSVHPDDRFNKISFGAKVDLEALWRISPTYTTCELLPGYIGAGFGVSGLAGLDPIRTRGMAKSAWNRYLPHQPGRLPQPGDLYAILAAGVINDFDGLIAHVGVIVKISGALWQTADAGQGSRPVQKAEYVERRFDAGAGTITGEVVKGRDSRPPRKFAGWLDVDQFFGPLEAHNGPGRLPHFVHSRA